MRKIVTILLAAAALVACHKPKIISDKELASIFHDAFLANAYAGDSRLRLDSLDIYEPIFARYGYTTEDVQVTIGNFSKRKSARLGDVVEVAIARLEAEGTYLNRETAILDTIDARARRAFSRTLYRDTLVTVYSLRDTVKMRFTVDSLRKGEYEVSFEYNVDSLDKNTGQRVVMRFEREDGVTFPMFNNTLRRRIDERVSRTLRNEGDYDRLQVSLAEFVKGNKVGRPHMTFRNVTVRFIPDAADVVDSLYLETINLGVFNHELSAIPATDSVAQTSAAR